MLELNDSDGDAIVAPVGVEPVEAAMSTVLPEKSKRHYENTYKQFKEWCENERFGGVSESVVMAYLEEKSKKVKAPTLWSTYSMLKTTLMINENLDIKKFESLLPYLKKKSVGHCAKRSQVFTREQIDRFLREAHNDSYLMMKIVLIMGVAGTCRRYELTQMTVDDVEDVGSLLIVKVPDRNTNTRRTFTVTNPFHVDLYREYVALRPKHCSSPRLFLKYNHGTCINQVVGINTIRAMPSLIAKYLRLPNPKTYTAHCFRRTSIVLKRYGGMEDRVVNVNVHMPSTSTTEPKMATGAWNVELPKVPAGDLKLPCPARNNVTEELKTRRRALTILNQLCPYTLRVRDVYPNGGGSGGCSWKVEYDIRRDVPQLSDDRTVGELYGRLPFYAKITWEEKTCLSPCWNVEYSVLNCDCGDGVDSIKLESTDCDFDYSLNGDIKIETNIVKQEY